ncbi:hypothetical protein HZZ00_37500 (plasmid) [Streptomyces sp. NEAU-sy36]|uniref:hypothetical protein n=1 Tax=unclassified Streptomyces TaxID=2593676 RepID=UPI0015D5A970|nr:MULTISPECIES: hypothetical protein [unclassified Streptomyces]QLJ06732.1 hypothetical protein HZZ00_37500 [Streptomyces sp. NEAU-sy36]
MAAKLAATVYVTDPDTHQTVVLEEGSEPEPRLAALVTNPAAWEDGKPPAAAKKAAEAQQDDDSTDDKPTAKKTAAARKPARGRTAADEGSSGD